MSFTERDSKLLAHVFQCFKSSPEIDLEKLASLAGYANKASANTAYHKLRTKITSFSGDEIAGSATPKTTMKATPKSMAKSTRAGKAAAAKVAAAAAGDDEGDEADEEASVTPAAKKGGKKAGKAAPRKPKVESDSEDEGRNLIGIKKAPAGKGKKRLAEDVEEEEAETKRVKAAENDEMEAEAGADDEEAKTVANEDEQKVDAGADGGEIKAEADEEEQKVENEDE